MSKLETKKLVIIASLAVLLLGSNNTWATDYTSTNFTVTNPVIDLGGSSSSSANFGLGQSFGQAAVGKSTSSSFQLWSGFQFFYKAQSNTLSATAGDGQVSLAWTVPNTFLGISVASYEVGVGTVSGSYVFTNRGNVTSYTQTGLTNGTQYFFKIKAKTASGAFLVFSNEATATPAAAQAPGGGGGGGGGAVPPPVSGTAAIVLSGLAYPGQAVTILRDGTVAANTIADPGAQFNVTLGNLGAATYLISVYATDENNRRSPALSFSQTLTNGVTSSVNNLFLGPTISLSHQQIKKGETLSIFGYTVPNSEVTLRVNSPMEFVEKVKSTLSGAYFKAFNTSALELGDHTTKSQSETAALVSPYSEAAAFKVAETSVETPVENCISADLSCDSKIDLTDFSILMFYWNQTNPANPRADVNKSGRVDLTDFSILLYYWTG